MWSDLEKKLDSFTFKTWKYHLIRKFLRAGRVRVYNMVATFQKEKIQLQLLSKNNFKS